MSDLTAKHCVPCHKGTPPLKGSALDRLAEQLPLWKVVEEHHLLKTFLFRDFVEALEFVNRVGAVAEQEGHHPDLCLAWGKVDVKIFTHKINGLSENDFILAARIDEVQFSARRGEGSGKA